MRRVRPANLGSGEGYFHGWDSYRFGAWLAGFFDGEGTVYLGKAGITVSVANTNRDVIESIARWMGVGTIEVRPPQKAGWNQTYIWRVRNYIDARMVLLTIRPYLTIKAADADRAISRIADFVARRRAAADRNDEILRLVAAGRTHKSIGERFGISRTSVTQVVIAASRRPQGEDRFDE